MLPRSLIAIFAACLCLPGYAASFTVLLPLEWNQTYPCAVSSDGAYITGYGWRNGMGDEAMRWSANGTGLSLGQLKTIAHDSNGSYGYAISANGQTVVGEACNNDVNYFPVQWTPATGSQNLQLIPAPPGYAVTTGTAYGVSADGSVIVGSMAIAQGGTSQSGAFRWTSAAGTVLLKPNSPHSPFAIARATSADGNVVVGDTTDNTPYRWTASQTTDLAPLNLPGYQTSATALSGDGQVALGFAYGTGLPDIAVRWDAFGIHALGENATAEGAVFDGSITVGYQYTSANTDAVVWFGNDGPYDLKNLLLSQTDIDLSGWELDHATAISADGLTIVGDGFNPNAPSPGFVVHLDRPLYDPASVPEPMSLALLTLGIPVLTIRRLRRRR